MQKTMPPGIRELQSGEDWQALYPLIRQLNPKLGRKLYTARLKAMREGGYRCVGAFEGAALVAAAGFWVGTRFWCGRYIDLDNVVVDEGRRNQGLGSKLTRWIEHEGKRLGCDMAVLDSYTSNHASHRFYFREGYLIRGYHFSKEL